MLNEDHRVTVIYKGIYWFKKFIYIMEMQPCRWLVKNK